MRHLFKRVLCTSPQIQHGGGKNNTSRLERQEESLRSTHEVQFGSFYSHAQR